MSSQFDASNPYASSNYAGPTYASAAFSAPERPQRESAPASLLAAAMALIAVAGLGLLLSGYNFAKSFGEAEVDPAALPMIQEIQRGAVGPVATGIQGGFVMLNLFIIICGVQMMKLQNWGLCATGSVLAMLNIGSCCCVVGLPVGIWSLMVLMSPEVMTIFAAAKQSPQ
jgi:hypothetical protein